LAWTERARTSARRLEVEARRERVLDLAERARSDAPVFGDRHLLVRRAHVDLRLERAAREDRHEQVASDAPDRVVLFLEEYELARDRAHAPHQRDARKARGLRLGHAVERRRDPALRCAHVVAALEELGRQPDGNGRRRRRKRHAGVHGCGRIAPDEHLDRPERVRAREVGLELQVAIREDGGFRGRGFELVALADAEAVARGPRALGRPIISAAIARCAVASRARNQLFATSAAIDSRA
jgi:hypothetical protein